MLHANLKAARLGSRRGLSLIEVLAVLAITALAAALVFPLGGRLFDRISVHASFFAVQRQILDARREAVREEVGIVFTADAHPEGNERTFLLPKDWSYVLDAPFVIEADGRCGLNRLTLRHRGRDIALLEGREDDCRLIRVR